VLDATSICSAYVPPSRPPSDSSAATRVAAVDRVQPARDLKLERVRRSLRPPALAGADRLPLRAPNCLHTEAASHHCAQRRPFHVSSREHSGSPASSHISAAV
jgi:hypothetical protein